MGRGIIFVDDEENILNGLRRSLRKMRREWKMDFALSGQEALSKLEEGGFDVIVSDMRMPGMDGAELLKRVHENYPQMTRIVLSGQCEEETVLRVIKYAHFFLSKPCNAEKLQSILNGICTIIERAGSDAARKMAFGLSSVPVFAGTIGAILRLKEAGIEDTERYTEVVSSDPMMAAKMLQLVHSHFFITMDDLFNVKRAVEIVTVRVLTELIERGDTFIAMDDSDNVTTLAYEIASHMTLSAELAVKIARSTGLSERDCNLVKKAALFHDIGKLIFIHEDPERYCEVHSATAVQDAGAETDFYGFSHAELGALLLSSWGFPEETVTAVESHESNEVGDHPTGVEVVLRLSNVLAHGIREGEPKRYMDDTMKNLMAAAGISANLDNIVETVVNDYRESVEV